ncbi:ankyrin repeat-containing domain protein [Dunaliella salina]|uniref:Ankyrin repeat-containing domain protein n=1 Tax=Dunaliella salina TaxID=3046 RepID=A0ABQ7GU21_DUNSA|nr:ankyrin repeat-containing domain protein [Dunaliella salina]|eukprot:KAF5838117.1 ankyrin repeat-containing domain protein [Dunaliella salina]
MEARKQALALKAALEANGYKTFCSEADIPRGKDWIRTISEALDKCRMVVVLATTTYGGQGTDAFATGEELAMARRTKKELYIVPMANQWEDATTRMLLGTMQMGKAWTSPPDKVPRDLLEDLLSCCKALPLDAGHASKEMVEHGKQETAKKDQRWTPLLRAAKQGNLTEVKALLAQGASTEDELLDGCTSLYLASQEGHLEVVRELINAGANIDKPRDTGATPLYIASMKGQLPVVLELISKGASVDHVKKDGWTPLLIASQNGHHECAKELISRGAGIDKALSTGSTPLLIAALNGREDVVRVLLSHGASLQKAKNDGSTPVSVAKEKGHESVVRLLMAHTEAQAHPDGIAPDPQPHPKGNVSSS